MVDIPHKALNRFPLIFISKKCCLLRFRFCLGDVNAVVTDTDIRMTEDYCNIFCGFIWRISSIGIEKLPVCDTKQQISQDALNKTSFWLARIFTTVYHVPSPQAR